MNSEDTPTNEKKQLTQPLIEQVSDIIIEPELAEIDWTAQNPPKWNGGLCDCFNNIYPSMIGSFLLAPIYAPILYGELTKNKFNTYKSAIVFFNLMFFGLFFKKYNSLIGNIFLSSSHIFQLCLINHLRYTTRKQNNIPGSNCEDMFVTIFFTSCSLSQTGRTLMNNDKICDC